MNLFRLALPLLLPAVPVAAQITVRPVPPTRSEGNLLLPPADAVQELGVKVEMFEDPNLDRFLHRARQFLDRQEYANAIRLLQDVVEGRTLEVLGQPPEGTGEPPVPVPPGAEEDPAGAVYAGDGRLYQPVRRLCHELLAEMSARGLELYRQAHEVAAERMLPAALAERDLHGLEQVYNRYFVTLSAGRAMAAAIDLQMDAGRYRAAIQVLRDLLEVYPAASRAALGISDPYLRLRNSVCLNLLGEHQLAEAALDELVAANPDASLRVMGELSPVSGLRERVVDQPSAPDIALASEHLALRTGREKLVPLWEARFRSPDPYRVSRNSSSRSQFIIAGVPDTGSGGSGVPRINEYQPGTSARFLGSSVAFMDHYCLRVHDALTGAILQTGDESLAEATRRRTNQIQSRIPLYDFAALRVEADELHYYTLVTRGAGGLPAVLSNHLVAHDRTSMESMWDTDGWHAAPGDDTALDYGDVTFLAAPTVFGSRLLVPVLHRGVYALQCVDRESGRPLWRTRIHSGGSDFLRAPGTQVGVQNGNAYFLTNAGALAAVDAHTGELRWIRKYERLHPLRERTGPSTRTRNTIDLARRRTFREYPLDGFVTSDLALVDGLVIFAPSDGRVLMCLDGASGEPVWMVSREGRYDFYGTLNYLIGSNATRLYMASDEHVVCLDLRTGARLWAARVPEYTGSRWRGRGLVTDDLVVLPGEQALLVHDADGAGEWHTLELPGFSPGREPLQGESNLFLSGPFLAAVYEGGIEVYSSDVVLGELAQAAGSPADRARYLAQAGELRAAIDVLEAWVDADPQAALRAGAPARMLSLSREVALAMAANGSRNGALGLLERARPGQSERDLRQRWHLARIDVFRLLHDLDALEREQQTLYSLMDGKG